MSERVICLTISEAKTGAATQLQFHLSLDGRPIATNQTLTVAQSQDVIELSCRYGALFEDGGSGQMKKDSLGGLGAQLFELWLQPHWSALKAQLKVEDAKLLVLRANLPAVLNLPWELLRPERGEAIGLQGGWALRRLPLVDQDLQPAPSAAELPAGPMRVLYMVAGPKDQAELDHEREEELLLRAFSKVGRDVVFDSCDMGSFEELGERIGAFRPHVVHLTGHGVAKEKLAYFAFESERGEADLRSAAQLGQLFAGHAVQCAFISACQAGKAPEQAALGGLAQGLLAEGVPLVIGWTASILDDVATTVAAEFFKSITSGNVSVDRALVSARQAARAQFAERDDPSWSLAVLYASSRQTALFDKARREEIKPSLRLQEPLPGMLVGSTLHFIGRRRELQKLLPDLRSGELQLLVLTGLGGVGKSTLATRLARKLEGEGLTPIALSSTDSVPFGALQLLEACGQAFLDTDQRKIYDRVTDNTLPVETRLRSIVDGINRSRFVLVLDNFESNMDEASRRIVDGDLAKFYAYLVTNLSGGSRVIITSRYLPAGTPLSGTTRKWQLGEFDEASFLKFMMRDRIVEQRYRKGELPHDLLVQLRTLLGGTPRFLDQIRKELERMPAEELKAELDKVVLPAADSMEQGVLQALRDKYCEDIFTARLFGQLTPDAQALLCRAAVFGMAVTAEGLATISGQSLADATRAAEAASDLALMHRANRAPPLWSAYGTLRSWLLAKMDPAEQKAAHLTAGEFLVSLVRLQRTEEMGINWLVCAAEARAQYIVAGNMNQARYVTIGITNGLTTLGWYGVAEALLAELLEHEEHPDSLVRLGFIASAQGQYTRAQDFYRRALAYAQAHDDRVNKIHALHNLATINLRQGDYKEARDGTVQALRIVQEIGDRGGEAAALLQLSTIDSREGHYDEARRNVTQALSILREADDKEGAEIQRAAMLRQLADIDSHDGDYNAAREGLRQALMISQNRHNRRSEAQVRHQLASVDINEGNYEAARKETAEAVLILQEIGDVAGVTAALRSLATIDLHEGNYKLARVGLVHSLSIARKIGDREGEAKSWYQLGALCAAQGHLEDGLRLIALCFLIEQAMGHGAAEKDFKDAAVVAGKLNFTQEQFDETLLAVAESYRQDAGAALLREALGNDDWAGS